MKMVMTLRVEWDVDDLADYDAETLQEAVKNQRSWIEDGTCDIRDFVDDMEVISIEGVE